MGKLESGVSVGRYILRDRIGQGGMGLVFTAEDTQLGRLVALKFLSPESTGRDLAQKRLTAEARAAGGLNHPNICTVYEISEWEGRSFIAMEHVAGRSLREELEEQQMPVERAAAIAIQVARGLAAAHREGVLHRDIKPANVIVTPDGQVKIVDFGIAKVADVDLTQTGTTVGSLQYMAPEQIDGADLDSRADVWGFGVTLYRMLTGKLPFQGTQPGALLYSILAHPHVPVSEVRPGVPTALSDTIDRCLQKDRGERFASMGEVLVALGDTARTELSGQAHRPRARGMKWRNRRPTKRALVAVMLGLFGSALFAVPWVRSATLDLFTGTSSALPTEKHLALLPFTVGVGTDSALADGVLSSAASRLRSIEPFQPSFWVIPGELVRERGIRTPQEAKVALGANLALEGALHRSGDSLRLDMTLIETETGEELRATSVSAPVSDVLAMQSALIEELVALLELQLVPASARLLAAGSTTAPDAHSFYLQGQGYLQRREELDQIDIGISLFERALEEDRGYALAHAGLGEAYLRKYQLTKDTSYATLAEESSGRAIEFDEQLTSPLLTLGLIQSEMGRYGPALASFNVVLGREPGNAAAYQGVAGVYESLGRLDEAETALRQAVALKPEYWDGYQSLGAFHFRRGEYEQALEQFLQVARLAPDNVAGLRSLGAAHFYLGNADQAIDAFERSLAIEPTYAVYMNVATLYFFLPDYQSAAESYRRALDINDQDYSTWNYLGAALELAGRSAEAAEALGQAILLAEARLDVNPRDLLVQAHLAWMHQRAGQPAVALRLIGNVEAADPSDAQVMWILVLVYEARGDRETALRWLARSLEAGMSPTVIESDPWSDDLRTDPRYRNLVASFQASG